MNEKGNTYIVMGVSGCGKTTLGKALAEKTGLTFYDGDDYHPAENIRKMSAGIPLTDADRKGWLERLNALCREYEKSGLVLACSALKRSYRDILETGLEQVVWVYLEGSYETILNRLQQREGHYMTPTLLISQFDALEPPVEAIRVPVEYSVEKAMEQIRNETTS